MKGLFAHTVLTMALAGFAFSGCGSQSPAPSTAPPFHGPAAQGVEFPVPPGRGEGREVRVLVDEPALKIVSIVLHAGTALPEHRSEVAVTITALAGSGTVVAGGERLPIDAAHAVVLAPSVAHAVEPDAGADLVLLVHHLGRGVRGEESHR